VSEQKLTKEEVMKRDLDTIVECITCEDGGAGFAKMRAFLDDATEQGIIVPFLHQFASLCRLSLGQAKINTSETVARMAEEDDG
jgi:hypothetical protein